MPKDILLYDVNIRFIITGSDNVGIKINYCQSTSSHTTNILSYMMLDDDVSYEKLSSKLEEVEVQGLIN